MTQTQPSAAPEGFAAAEQAAADRLANAFPEARAPGDGAPPAASPPGDDGQQPAPFDILADDALDNLPLQGMQYQDGKRLEAELRRSRETFKPLNDAFGGMSDEARQALLESAPTLGDDIGFLGQVMTRLHPDDRQYFRDAMELMATDPIQASQMLARGAELIQSHYQMPGQPQQQQQQQWEPPAGQQPMPEWADPQGQYDGQVDEGYYDPADQPLTVGQMEQMLAQRDWQHIVTGEEQAIVAEAQALGYDLDSSDPVDAARFNNLLFFLGREETGGDVELAHQYAQAMDQAAIDRFVQAKAADAGRPVPPVNGEAPMHAREPIVSMSDGEAAMRARLDGTLGPDPRARSADD
jgi:hypothetical protein